MSIESKLFGIDLPISPKAKNGLGKEGEVLWFRRLRFARNAATKAETTKARNHWQAQADLCMNYIASANVAMVKKASYVASRKVFNLDKDTVRDEIESGLFEAFVRIINRFNIAKGTRFSTYAMKSLFREGTRIAMREHKLAKRFKTFQRKDDREPLIVADTRQAERNETNQQLELLAVAKSKASLSNAEINVLDMRFRLEMTLEAIGAEMSLSKERIRQIEAKALKKIRESMSELTERQVA
jgi:RNA polymerase sigma factor (sigma-70 family)